MLGDLTYSGVYNISVRQALVELTYQEDSQTLFVQVLGELTYSVVTTILASQAFNKLT